MRGVPFALLASLLGTLAFGQTPKAIVVSAGQNPAPQTLEDRQDVQLVTLCQLARDPARFNQKLVRITGDVTQGFEDFTLSDPKCNTTTDGFSLWLMYGGTMNSGTVYCCPGEGANPSRGQGLEAEQIKIPLIRDDKLKQFTAALKRKPHTVKATVVGVFFSGEQRHLKDKIVWEGYGHLGCCSLLAIQQVEEVSSAQAETVPSPRWWWFQTCSESTTIGVEVVMDGKLAYRSSFPICNGTGAPNKPDGKQKILSFSFNGGHLFQGEYHTTPAQTVEGNIWQAGADPDDLILGVSFATKNQVLLNTVHIVRPGGASESEVDPGIVVKTYPVTHK